MRRRDFIKLLGATTVSPVAARAQRPGSIDDTLRDAAERKEIPGVVAMAADRNGVIYQGAFGMADIADARSLKHDALFRLASMTKPITAVAAMQLVEQGRIGLDAPIERYFPEFASQVVLESFDAATGAYKLRPATRSITVRHLFTHTSGLGYRFTSPTLRDYKPRAGDTARPLLFEPGEQWLYGTSTDWLGRLLEKVSGLPLDAYFQKRLFTPLKMSETFYDVPKAKEARLVAIHRRRADGSLMKQPLPPPSKRPPVHTGGGGLSSTASDYVRFTRMLLNGGELDGVRVLAPGSVDTIAQNHIGGVGVQALRSAAPTVSEDFSFIADGRDKFGLGFLITSDAVPGKRSPGSLSWGGVYNTYFWVDRTRGIVGVILMQFLPFADRTALALLDAFERGVYRLADAAR
jgi:methyl acetate hydrolase